jgi:hypothetical protein
MAGSKSQKQEKKKAEPQKYRVLSELYWSPGNKAHPGDVRDDIPEVSLGWLKQQGHIVEYEATVPVPAKDIAAPEEGGNK